MAKLMLTMLAAFATFERDLIGERQAEGIAISEDEGRLQRAVSRSLRRYRPKTSALRSR